MGERLTRLSDETVSAIADQSVRSYPGEAVLMAVELKERRAADLSAEDVEALDWARSRMELLRKSTATTLNREFNADIDRAISVLDRIINGGGR